MVTSSPFFWFRAQQLPQSRIGGPLNFHGKSRVTTYLRQQFLVFFISYRLFQFVDAASFKILRKTRSRQKIFVLFCQNAKTTILMAINDCVKIIARSQYPEFWRLGSIMLLCLIGPLYWQTSRVWEQNNNNAVTLYSVVLSLTSHRHKLSACCGYLRGHW